MPESMHEQSNHHPFMDKPNRTLLHLALPVLFSLVAEPLTGLADTAFIARLPGSEPVAALGIGTVAFTSIFWAFAFLGISTQTEVAQSEGGHAHEQAVKILSLACVLAAGVGVVILFGAMGFLPPIAGLLGAEGPVNDLACEYMFYRLLGAPAVLISLACFGGLRGVQDMHTPFYVAVGINIVNVLLDWLLIFGCGPVAPMGVAGAAIASTVSQWVGAGWCLWAAKRRIGLTWHMHGAGLVRLMKVGGDLFVRTGSLLIFMALCTRVANRFGPDEGAAYQAIRQSFLFTAMFLDAFAITGQSMVGYFFGTGDLVHARKVAWSVCLWSLGTGVVLCILMLFGEQAVAWLLVPSAAYTVFGPAWVVVAFSQPIGALSFATDGIHWGTGDFRYLRNGMLVASVLGGVCVLTIEYYQPQPVLVYIWLATLLWTVLRAGFGLVRIWPGVGQARLALPTR